MRHQLNDEGLKVDEKSTFRPSHQLSGLSSYLTEDTKQLGQVIKDS